ncbi:unnamed protein product [Caenorhabditis auriculariae]|uniref:Sphingomyelin synthase-like domain-containing protein n=1 Tax=Caenorhabditis auriculariae TaxID=2777116 RepID=A0A8S1GZB0_9PELO|nr:unnamed protein product [Caenorhabditis auriculariae]
MAEPSSDRMSASESSTGGSSSSTSTMTSTSFEPLKWLFLFVCLALAGLSNWAVIAYTHDFVPRHPLPDIMFALMPEQKWASVGGDMCVVVNLVCFGLLLFFHVHRTVILRRILFTTACLYGMRSVTLTATQLPSAYTNNSQKCRPQVDSQASVFFSRWLEQSIRLGFQEKNYMLCGDLLFSGHTLVMVNCALFVAYYLPRRIRFLQWATNIPAAFGMLCMTISRTHYTIDVIIAYWLTNFVFRIYHAYCEVDIYMERRKSILHSWWPCKVIDWLEENIVPGRIENVFSMPFVRRLDPSMLQKAVSRQHTKQISISSSSTLP